MDIDREEVLGIARFERDALGRTVQYTPPSHWEAESPRDDWRVKDVLAHLASTEVAAAAVVADEDPAEVEEYRKTLDGEPFRSEAWRRWAVERRRDASPVSLGLEWGRAADQLLSRAGQASDEDWREKQVPWIAGDIRLRYLVQARVAEWWVHGEDIREGGRLPPRREHWPIYVVNDLAVRLIPYALSLAGEQRGGKAIRIELDRTGGGVWNASTDPGRDAETGARPDAIIEGDGYAFASVAGGRADPDVCLYEGLLLTGGDTGLAETVLRTLRSAP
ncbi:MAG TPA: maleylpyruvate isomerase family mycothiol-dependent enzyme [Actinomycetota bacterium]|nr:maleylpyruvate isomerase family mycothiol-dependent enzyme [Actinomycetota bacterium]